MADLCDLGGKVALVTGGVGGIGSAITLALAENGADIIVADIEPEPKNEGARKHVEEIASKIKAAGRKRVAVKVDVTDEKSVADMVKKSLEAFPTIDILVNAHGIAIRKPADTFPIDEWQKVMDINTRGVFLTCQAVGRVMIKQRSGRIINLSSVRDRYGLPTDYAAYCPSKGAVSALTITLACEWAKHNVLVNAVAPTIVETALTRDALQNPDYAKMMKARIPLGRWAMPEDVAKPVVFLASKAADFITGQIIYIDGGVTTW